ncbi:hypothetical protein CEXT_500521 [Caerostris extrusa]|uniref:Uncharacterized protein n=1 Tax=Caerostris extrusa TaxID=172846 RepID=A0AAV4UJN8_CAEEX|nr:hypothetical protein CEXT_500521 [Caerostris extrusa]
MQRNRSIKIHTLQKPQIHRNSSEHLHVECGNTEPNKGIWIYRDKQEKKKAHPHNPISIRSEKLFRTPIPFCCVRSMNIHRCVSRSAVGGFCEGFPLTKSLGTNFCSV